MPCICQMKDASLWAAGTKIDAAFTQSDRRPARGKSALLRERRRHSVSWQLTPMLTVIGAQNQKFAAHRIAQRHTVRAGAASQRVQKESRAPIRRLTGIL